MEELQKKKDNNWSYKNKSEIENIHFLGYCSPKNLKTHQLFIKNLFLIHLIF